jgi:4-amino-4-deoxy-L-arabinose transferase-like glycosyltransferase
MNFILKELIKKLFGDKNWIKIIILLLFSVCIFKLPALFTSDIQPWDEGMYAVRVLSIHTFGDFLDQVEHSVAKFDSGSHPPLLIWIGYLSTLIFGINEFAFKIIPFVFALLCIIYISKAGKFFNSPQTGIYASLIFAGTYFFTVYSKRFQFDIPLTFFILISLYCFILFLEERKKSLLIFSGIFFGLSLMTKALVGFYIPAVLFLFLIITGKKSNIKFLDIFVPVIIGLIIALPWHLFMFYKYGLQFSDFILGFHLISRAVETHEGIKQTGFYYFFNILLNNIPFGILLLISFVKDIRNFKHLEANKILLWIWFLAGILSITLFKTKLETYLLPFLIPACILLVLYMQDEKEKSKNEKSFIIFLLIINVIWFLTQNNRNNIKDYLINPNIFEILIALTFSALIVFILFRAINKFADKANIKSLSGILIILFFIGQNIFFMFKLPGTENSYILSDIKKEIDKCGRNNIVYISTDFKYNPQFTYYFNGIDMGWKNHYNYELNDLKNGIENVKRNLETKEKNRSILIVERDFLNPGTYYDSRLFVPDRFKLIKKFRGYEMYLDE